MVLLARDVVIDRLVGGERRDQRRDLLAEALLEIGNEDVAVLDYIVQKRCGDHRLAETPS